MSGEEYLAAVQALRGLAKQTAQAVQDAQAQQEAPGAVERMRHGDAVLADGRDRMIAAVTRSKESLQSMGLQGLPPGPEPEPLQAQSFGHADDAMKRLETLALEATSLSVAQADASSEHRRLTAAAARAKAVEERQEAERRRLVAEEKARREREARELAERQRRERERLDAERQRLQTRLQEVQAQRDVWTRKSWRPSKKRELAALDAELASLKAQFAHLPDAGTSR